MWLWSRPWPYAWLWGSGSDYQKTASVIVGVTASVVESSVSTDSSLISKSHAGSYGVSASTDDFDEVFLAFESAQIYYISGSASYEIGVSAEADLYWVVARVTAPVVWVLDQVGSFPKSASATAQLSASVSEYLITAESSTSVTAQLSAPITEVTVSIFYGYTASAEAFYITASVDAALQVVEAFISKSFNNVYYVSASASYSLQTNTNQRGKLVWKKKRGYVYVATSV